MLARSFLTPASHNNPHRDFTLSTQQPDYGVASHVACLQVGCPPATPIRLPTINEETLVHDSLSARFTWDHSFSWYVDKSALESTNLWTMVKLKVPPWEAYREMDSIFSRMPFRTSLIAVFMNHLVITAAIDSRRSKWDKIGGSMSDLGLSHSHDELSLCVWCLIMFVVK